MLRCQHSYCRKQERLTAIVEEVEVGDLKMISTLFQLLSTVLGVAVQLSTTLRGVKIGFLILRGHGRLENYSSTTVIASKSYQKKGYHIDVVEIFLFTEWREVRIPKISMCLSQTLHV